MCIRDSGRTDRQTDRIATAIPCVALHAVARKKRKIRSFSHPFGHLGVTYALHRWKARGRLYIRCIWTFSLSPTVETLWAEIGRSWRFSKGVGHFERKFQREGAFATNHCWCHKTRVISVSCGIKISAVHHLVLSQYTNRTDRRTDRIPTAIPCT